MAWLTGQRVPAPLPTAGLASPDWQLCSRFLPGCSAEASRQAEELRARQGTLEQEARRRAEVRRVLVVFHPLGVGSSNAGTVDRGLQWQHWHSTCLCTCAHVGFYSTSLLVLCTPRCL
jgi:hypothetical protein